MNRDGVVLAQKLEKYPAEASACITGVAFVAAGVAVFAIAGAVGVSAVAVWLLAAILTIAGLGFIAHILWDFVRYRRTPQAIIECREGELFVLGIEEECSAITHVAVSEARGRKGPLGWGTLLLRSGERQIVCRYVQDVKEAQARVIRFIAAQRKQGESND